MNQLVKFENTTIDVQIINGTPMFELYAVGMALGYARSNGKLAGEHGVHPENKVLFPYKSRIDKVCANAEIKPVVHGVQPYITESQLYDFMLEARTDKCRTFRKWLTNEVLPALNHTGTYSVPKPTQKKLYDYRDKTFRGTPVMSVQDVEHFTNLDPSRIRQVIKQIGKGQDFIILTGVDLAAFKYENSMPSSTANHMYLVTKSGFDKICAAYGLKPKMPELFIETTPPVSSKKTECLRLEKVLVQENKKFQRHIKDLTCCLKAMESLLFLVNDDNLSPESVKYKTNSIADLAASIAGGALALSSTKFETRIVEY